MFCKYNNISLIYKYNIIIIITSSFWFNGKGDQLLSHLRESFLTESIPIENRVVDLTYKLDIISRLGFNICK